MQSPSEKENSQLSLYELNHLIRQTLQNSMESHYWVVAEVGELRVNQKGHCYMELIDKQDQKILAKARATVWAYEYYTISRWFESVAGQPLQAGMKILARVVVSYHELYGLSLNIKDIDPKYTLGERARRRQEVIDQLVAEGVYDMNREQELTLMPQRIAIISSATAAGYGDFIDQLHNNSGGYRFHTQLFQALMQGDAAVDSIITAMHEVFEQLDDFDALVIIRGGGAQTDLDCFDSYEVAAHTAQFPLPVISGIGHERDETLTDLVANTRMKTPTAVAEFLISRAKALDEQLNDLAYRTASFSLQYLKDQMHYVERLTERLSHYTQRHVSKEQHQVERLERELKHAVRQMLSEERSKVMSLNQTLNFAVKHQLNSEQQKLERLAEKVMTLPQKLLADENRRLEQLEKSVRLIDPVNVLKRGYSITTLNGQLLHKAQEVREGDELMTRTDKQTVTSKVIKDQS